MRGYMVINNYYIKTKTRKMSIYIEKRSKIKKIQSNNVLVIKIAVVIIYYIR
ncbi:MAG: hypothetical protein KatS3mg079_193 [Caloramator sp.]|nr:MAG: hypothetical protein KatS3mg079_193 [Caloramator sp.]